MIPALFFLIAFLSEVIGTIAGFGSSVFFVPLAGFLFGFHEVLALTSILHVFSNAAKLVLFGRHVKLRLLLLLGVPSVLFVILGAFLSRRVEFKFTELILGLFLILFSLLLWFRPTAKLAPNSLNAITCGGIAGFPRFQRGRGDGKTLFSVSSGFVTRRASRAAEVSSKSSASRVRSRQCLQPNRPAETCILRALYRPKRQHAERLVLQAAKPVGNYFG